MSFREKFKGFNKRLDFNMKEDLGIIKEIEKQLFTYESELNIAKNIKLTNEKITSCQKCNKKRKIITFKYELCNFCYKYCCDSCLIRSRLDSKNHKNLIHICNKCNRSYYLNLLNKTFFEKYEYYKNYIDDLKDNINIEGDKMKRLEIYINEFGLKTGKTKLEDNSKNLQQEINEYTGKIENINEIINSNKNEIEEKFDRKIKRISFGNLNLIKEDKINVDEDTQNIQNEIRKLKNMIFSKIDELKNEYLEEPRKTKSSMKKKENSKINNNHDTKTILDDITIIEEKPSKEEGVFNSKNNNIENKRIIVNNKNKVKDKDKTDNFKCKCIIF